MSNPKTCLKCGMQKRHHPDSEYLKLFTKPHQFVDKVRQNTPSRNRR